MLKVLLALLLAGILGAAAFYTFNIGVNWWFYARRGAERPC